MIVVCPNHATQPTRSCRRIWLVSFGHATILCRFAHLGRAADRDVRQFAGICIVAKLDAQRLKKLESRLGAAFPGDFITILEHREPIDEGDVAVQSETRIWDVRTTYSLDDDRGEYEQLDRLYARVGHVLPTGALPFASDWGGNFYCLMLSGSRVGQVVWWDHEREAGDDSVEPVAISVADFFARLAVNSGE